MNAKRVSAAAGVVFAAMQDRQTAAGIAAALESACLLQSPETAAELEHLRKDRDGFRDQRNGVFKTNERLLEEIQQEQVARLLAENETRTHARELERMRKRVAELEAAAGNGATRTVDEDPIAYALTPAAEVVPTRRDKSVAKLRALLAGQREDAYRSPLHHDYAVPHDLPEVRS